MNYDKNDEDENKKYTFTGLVSVAALLSSCNDFQEINEDPNLVGEEDKVKPQWFLNASIMGDQMNPEIASVSLSCTGPCFPVSIGKWFYDRYGYNDYSTIYLSNDYAVRLAESSDQSDPAGRRMVANGGGGYLSLL